MNVFHIKHFKGPENERFMVEMETPLSKYKAFERIMWTITLHHLKQKQIERIERLLELLTARVELEKRFEAGKKFRANK